MLTIESIAQTLPGTQIEVRSWKTQEEAIEKISKTFDWDAAEILTTLSNDSEIREKVAGRSWHIGDGIWLMTCGHCDAYSLTYGSQPAYDNLGPHMVEEHDAQVGGINVGILG